MMCDSAFETSTGWPVRSMKRSVGETGNVFRYSRQPAPSRTMTVAPKLHLQMISANGRAGWRNMLRKPSPVGDQVAIVFSITQGGSFGFGAAHFVAHHSQLCRSSSSKFTQTSQNNLFHRSSPSQEFFGNLTCWLNIEVQKAFSQ